MPITVAKYIGDGNGTEIIISTTTLLTVIIIYLSDYNNITIVMVLSSSNAKNRVALAKFLVLQKRIIIVLKKWSSLILL